MLLRASPTIPPIEKLSRTPPVIIALLLHVDMLVFSAFPHIPPIELDGYSNVANVVLSSVAV